MRATLEEFRHAVPLHYKEHPRLFHRLSTAILLLVAQFILQLGVSNAAAKWLSIIVGVAALLLAALTDHPAGIVRIIPYPMHLWVDRAVGVVFLAAPFAFGFTGLDAWYYWVLGIVVISLLNAPESNAQGVDLNARKAM